MSMFSWFGYAAVPKAKAAWGARAIFKPHLDSPLDLLPDRQGYMVDCEKLRDDWPSDRKKQYEKRWEDFRNLLKKAEAVEKLQEISKNFNSDSKDKFVRRFPCAEEGMVLVAQGSPNASCGYFYLSVSLVEEKDAPEDLLCESEQFYVRREEEARKREAENERLRPIIRKQMREEREQAALLHSQIEARIAGRSPKNSNSRLEAGDYLETYANQDYRPAFVLAVDGDKALIEYFMPMGMRCMWIVEKIGSVGFDFDNGKSVSEKRMTKKWKKLIDEQLAVS